MDLSASYHSLDTRINPLHAIFFRKNFNMYLLFISFHNTDMPQVVVVIPRVKQGTI